MDNEEAISTRAESEVASNKQCALCGHDYPCGVATVDEGGETLFLCHTDSHSCYHLWTVYGLRPVDG